MYIFHYNSNVYGKESQLQGCLYLERLSTTKVDLLNEKSPKLCYYHNETAKTEFVLKKLPETVLFLINQRHKGEL